MGRVRVRSAGVVACGVLVVATCVPTGCSSSPTRGYSFEATFDESIKTVSVPVIENRSFFRGLERDATDALIKEIQRRTPWTVLQGIEADATLTVRIDDARLQTLATSTTTGLVQELAMVAQTGFTLRDNRSGKVLVARERFASAGAFVPDPVARERIAVGQRELAQRLAQDIVGELRSGW